MLKQPKYVWKVVRRSESPSIFRSLWITDENCYSLKYQIGKPTVPAIGKIFTFRTRQAAKDYLKYGSGQGIIFKCSYTGTAETPTHTSFFLGVDSIRRFWEGDTKVKDTWFPPNTVLVESVTPIEFAR